MWVMTTAGFFSVVAYDAGSDATIDTMAAYKPHPDPVQTEDVLVRTRSEADIRYLCEQVPGATYKETPNADYRYRTVMSKTEWANFLSTEVERIDYANFKSRTERTQGRERHELYLRVWSVLRDIRD